MKQRNIGGETSAYSMNGWWVSDSSMEELWRQPR